MIRRALEETNWDLLACALPSNVLLVSGYWPAAGFSMAVATRAGEILLVVPEDEEEEAENSWADEVATYCAVPLDRVSTAEEPVFDTFAQLRVNRGISANRIGFEQAESSERPSFTPYLSRASAARILRRNFPTATLAPADELLAQMRSVKTSPEIGHIRIACNIARQVFHQASGNLRDDVTEAQTAGAFRGALLSCLSEHSVRRCDGFVYCMSGPNSARAFGPYSRSRNRTITTGDLVIVRCHSFADGYWADITRTYHLGEVEGLKRKLFEAVLGARDTVVAAVRPGVRAADIDQLARGHMASHGLSEAFKHPAGHGIGFAALDYTARPRLHPRSDDVIEAGMVLKIEPGVYVEGVGGVRHSDMLAVTDTGAEILTPFQWRIEELTLSARQEEE